MSPVSVRSAPSDTERLRPDTPTRFRCDHAVVSEEGGAPTGVFVYGTLMPGQGRWPALASFAAGSRPAMARGHLWDTGLGYPAARFDSGGGQIPGVLVTIAPDLLASALVVLDRIEDEGVLFRRVEVVTSAGPALSYEWLGRTEGFRLLAGGWPGR